MGAWDTGVFSNDSALDWVYELLESSDLTAVLETLNMIIESGDYVEVDEGSAGLAAIEVLNSLNGKPPTDLPEEVIGWVQTHSHLSPDAHLDLAKRALTIVANEEISEVAGLWLDEGRDWSRMIENISARFGV